MDSQDLKVPLPAVVKIEIEVAEDILVDWGAHNPPTVSVSEPLFVSKRSPSGSDHVDSTKASSSFQSAAVPASEPYNKLSRLEDVDDVKEASTLESSVSEQFSRNRSLPLGLEDVKSEKASSSFQSTAALGLRNPPHRAALPTAKRAAPARRRVNSATRELLELNMQKGSDDEGGDRDIAEHDQDSEDELFEDAPATHSESEDSFEEADNSLNHMVDCEGSTSVAEEEPPREIDMFDSDVEGDPAHQRNVQLPEGGPVLDTDSDSDDAAITTDAQPSQGEEDDPLYHVDTDVDEPSDEEDVGAWVRNIPPGFPQVPEFTGTPGIQVDLGEDPSPLDVFSMFVDETILRKIKRETNKYARSCIQEKQRGGPLPAKSLWSSWKSVTMADVKNFLAICIHMGLVRKPAINDYWSTDAPIYTAYASQIMSRDRFKSILAFLHVNDNSKMVAYGRDGHDPIYKIRPLVEHLQGRFKAVYEPEREICIDEAMCPFKGRSRFKVFMKDKPIKWGFKFYQVCESKSGYVYRFEMFCQDRRLSNKPYDVVLRLLRPLLNKGYHVFMDNYYCEPKICSTLSTRGTMACGTVRKNWLQMYCNLGDEKLDRGQVTYRRRGNVIACRWRDRNDVFTLSTMHRPELEWTQCRTEDTMKPKAVIEYIKHMAGVDMSSQLMSFFPMHRRQMKWWKKPFFHLLTLCLIQTMIVLNKHRRQNGRQSVPLDRVVREILMDLPTMDVDTPEDHGVPRIPVFRLTGRHFLENVKTRKLCVVCYAKNKARGATRTQLKGVKRSRYWCTLCKKALCPAPCFQVYHTVKNYAVP